MTRYRLFLITAFFLTVLVACKENTLPVVPPDNKNDVNEWIYQTMDKNYLWYEQIPDKAELDFSLKPDAFFTTLLCLEDGRELYGEHLYYSYIEPSGSTKAASDNSAYGFEFATVGVQETNYYYAWVLYVLPGSPAEEAGLKRGDWIIAVGDEQGYITDRDCLVSGGETIFYLARYNENRSDLVFVGQIHVPAARSVEDTPFLKDTVFRVGEKNIAYLVYNHFTSGPSGSNDQTYDNRMKQIFAGFKQQQATEMVLDLRYNGGGQVSCAQLLTSMLAPSDALGDVFCYIEDNDKNSSRNQTPRMLTSVSSYNLNLNRLYVLTGMQTASASEAVINCLIPYLGRENIVLIGHQTLGKTVGSMAFGESENTGWILHPITSRIFNKDRQADYNHGFVPDIEVNELVLGQELYGMGDKNELLLAKAIGQITGQRNMKAAMPERTGRQATFHGALSGRRPQGLIVDPVDRPSR